jgi:hypothetical protein
MISCVYGGLIKWGRAYLLFLVKFWVISIGLFLYKDIVIYTNKPPSTTQLHSHHSKLRIRDFVFHLKV